jgi:hypothetical protein
MLWWPPKHADCAACLRYFHSNILLYLHCLFRTTHLLTGGAHKFIFAFDPDAIQPALMTIHVAIGIRTQDAVSEIRK